MKKIIDKKMEHLSEQKICEVVTRYYNGEMISDLRKEFSLRISSRRITQIFPIEELDNELCLYCDIPLYQKYLPRENDHRNERFCMACKHVLAAFCSCSNCRALKKQKEENINLTKKEILKTFFSIENYEPPISYNELSFKEALYLLCFFRGCITDDITCSISVHEAQPPIAPTEELSKLIVKYLYENGFIEIDPSSELTSFTFINEEPVRFNCLSVRYRLLLGETETEIINYIHGLEDIAYSNIYTEQMDEEVIKLWRELALHECLEYWDFVASKHSIPVPKGDKTRLMFLNLLKDFSVSQVFYFIWLAAKKASSNYLQYKISKSHAGNSMVNACQNSADSARSNNWVIKHYRRPPDCPQTVLSCVLHNVFLHNGEKALDIVIQNAQTTTKSLKDGDKETDHNEIEKYHLSENV